MKRCLLSTLFLCLFLLPLQAQEYLKTWLDVGSKRYFYASYAAQYHMPLASNYDVSAAFAFQWDGNPSGKTDATHAITLEGINYFPLNESASRAFNTLALHQKLMFRDLSVWGMNEYAAALSLSYRRARLYGELGLMHRILQDIHWEEHSASSRYLNEPFGLMYRLALSLFDPRENPQWNLSLEFSDYDDFVWERGYTPHVALSGHWYIKDGPCLFSKLMYMPSGVFNLNSDVYKCYARVGIVCNIK